MATAPIVSAKIALQGDRLVKMEKNVTNHPKYPADRSTEQHLRKRLSIYLSEHTEFMKTHAELCMAVPNKTGILYFDEDIAETFEEAYLTVHAAAQTKLDKILEEKNAAAANVSGVNLHEASLNGEPNDALVHALNALRASSSNTEMRLQPAKLPTFSGKYVDWNSFHDQFMAFIHRTKYPKVQKLQYLLGALDDTPKSVISHLPVTDASYEPAWELLKHRYGNDRVIFSEAMSVLLSFEAGKEDSVDNLQSLSSLLHETIQCMKNVGVDVDAAGPILTYLIIERMPPETRIEFEKSVKDKTTLPTVNDVTSSINTSLRTLELIGAAGRPTNNIQQANKHRTNNNSSQPTATNQQTHKGRSVKSFHFGAKSKSDKPHKPNQANAFKCPFCETEHFSIRNCPKFLAMSVNDRVTQVGKLKLCRNCLGHTHLMASCYSAKNCGECGGRHHTLTHTSMPANQQTNVSSASNTSVSMNTNVNIPHSLFRSTLLSTAVIQVCDQQGNKQNLRALVDAGGEASAITESAVQFLQLKKSYCPINVTHLDGAQSSSKSYVTFNIHTKNSSFTTDVNALVMKSLVAKLPSREIHYTKWPHIEGLILADPHFNRSGPIDVILGAEVYGDILRSGVKKGPNGTPTAQNTELGWLLVGKAYNKPELSTSVAMHHGSLSIDQLLGKFFEIEDVADDREYTNDEQYCIDFFNRTHQRNTDGRFVLELPFRSPIDATAVLGRSRDIALRQFLQLEKRFARDANLKREYVKCINEYLQLNHAQVMNDTESDHLVVSENGRHSYTSCYLPHHPVIKETSTSTRLRVVFNAAKLTSNGKSLNSIMFPGPVMLNDLFGILVNWRFQAVAFVADITKMYRQILLHPDYITYHRFLFRSDASEEIKEYALNRLTFGTNYAPCGAIQTLRCLAAEVRNEKPEAADAIEMDTYMDDTISGAADVPSALRIQRELIDILHTAGYELKKWASNSDEVLQAVPESDREVNIPLSLNQDDCVKALGIYWNTSADAFGFAVNFESYRDTTLTKRIVLSLIARIFDPLGLLAPVIVKAKIFMKQLWKLNSTWDDPLPREIASEWREFAENLKCLPTIKIDRWIQTKRNASIQLHLFCDASVNAFGVAAYVRNTDEHGNVTTNIIASKSKVTPIKQLTIPRLELCAAFMLTKLLTRLRKTIRHTHLRPEDIWLWSDSQIVLHWIKGDPNRWKVFVSNRIVKILEKTRPEQWYYVNTHDNPADIVSRGMLPFELKTNDLWFSGPSWLRLPEENWPTKDTMLSGSIEDESTVVIERSSIAMNVITQSDSCDTLLQYCSSYTQLLRYSCWLVRFGEYLRTKDVHRSKYLTPREINAIRMRWVRYVQRKQFGLEISLTRNAREMKTKNRLWALNPFIDEKDIFRVGGRLANAQIAYDERHPVILSSECHFTNLLINHAHRQTLHGGAQLTLAYLRKCYWVLNGRNTVRTKIHKCIVCHRQRGETVQQLMADLPACRVRQPIRPFVQTGVDLCGPITIRTSKLRGSKVHKGYIALFICMAVKAVHLEPVVDASSEGFLMAFQRFVSRRGLCTDLYADNGTNFVGAKRILQQDELEYLQLIHTELVNTLANKGVTFHFNPPSAPSFGGLWESNIRCVKHHLIRTMGDGSMTYDDLATVLTRIESCLNSRPLIPMTNDPEDFTYITPGHFMIGDSLLAIPEPNLIDEKVTPTDRYRMMLKRTQIFWSQWQSEYLKMLQQRPKWLKVNENLQVGNIVLIKDERLPPLKWLLGKILDVHPGSDGLVRVCTVKTINGIYKRPVVKLSLLPIKENETISNLIEPIVPIELNGEGGKL